MRRTLRLFVLGAALAVAAACGKSRTRGEDAVATGGQGTSGMNTAGAGLIHGTGATGEDGGEGGAPAGGTAGDSGGVVTAGGSGAVVTAGVGGGAAFAGRAGASSGGTTSGGGSNGGAAGGGMSSGGAPAGAAAAGAPAIAVPDGCSPVVQHVGGAYCSSEIKCGSQDLILSCNPSAAGPWLCLCTQNGTSSEFDFPEATGTQTCEVGADACLHPELFTGDETCAVKSSVSTSTCTAVDTCTRTQTIDGVEITSSTPKSMWTAAIEGSETVSCNCTGISDYLLNLSDFSAGCDFLKPLCTGDPPTPGAWTCQSTYDTSPPGYGCESTSFCTRPLTLNDGSTLEEAAQYSASCVANADTATSSSDPTRCACTGADLAEDTTLLLDLAQDDIGSCHTMLAACTGTAPLTLAGSVSCDVSNVDVTATTCTQTLFCSQAATTAATNVSVETRVVGSCGLQTDGSWLCDCALSGDMLTLDASDGTLACTQAVAECPKVAQALFE